VGLNNWRKATAKTFHDFTETLFAGCMALLLGALCIVMPVLMFDATGNWWWLMPYVLAAIAGSAYWVVKTFSHNLRVINSRKDDSDVL